MKPDNDAVDALKYTEYYKKDKLYIIIVPERRELFISSVKQDMDALTGAELDCLSRLSTLAWKGSTTARFVDQLDKSSRSKKDLPGIMSRIVKENDFDNICDSQTD